MSRGIFERETTALEFDNLDAILDGWQKMGKLVREGVQDHRYCRRVIAKGQERIEGYLIQACYSASLPTGFYTCVKGTGNWNGFDFDNAAYSGSQGTVAGTSWFVTSAPGAGYGRKTRLGVQRTGLTDHAGTYATNTNIAWSKW